MPVEAIVQVDPHLVNLYDLPVLIVLFFLFFSTQ
jgi:hypothetical protein